MQRRKTLHWYICMVLLLQAPVCIRTTQIFESTTPKSFSTLEIIAPKGASQPTYFFMDPNGSYKYAFDTGSGITSEQSANQANEVTGQYSYYENGIPYMVKYKAGVQGYQAEIIPGGTTSPQTNKNIFTASAKATTPSTATATRTATLPILSQRSQLSVRSTLPQGNVNSAATLQFVQDMMRTMRSQPIQLSFSAQQAHLLNKFQLPSNPVAIDGTKSATTRNAATSLNRAVDFEQLNRLETLNSIVVPAPTAAATSIVEPFRQPYAFSYSSEQSARSESADQSGNVVGKYSYYDEAGFHELNYKAGDGIGFVVLGGNLATQKDAVTTQKSTLNVIDATARPSFIPIGVSQPQLPHPSYSYSILPENNDSSGNFRRSENRNTFEQNGRSLRKFRRHVKW